MKSPVPGDNTEWCTPFPPLSRVWSPPERLRGRSAGSFPEQRLVTHGLKDTVGSHEVNTMIFGRPVNKLQKAPQCTMNVKICLL